MVSWPNSSIRKVSEMPTHLLGAEERGIVAETEAGAPGGRGGGRGGVKRRLTVDVASHARLQDLMIESLQKLSWRRVDVRLPAGAGRIPHNYIQARPADEHSLQVTKHLADLLL